MISGYINFQGFLLPYLIERSVASEYNMRVIDLNDTLTQTHHIGANADGAAGDHGNGDNLLVGL